MSYSLSLSSSMDQSLLESILPTHSVNYTGYSTRESDYSCQVLASHKNLFFDEGTQTFIGTESFDKNYLKVIENSVEDGLLLVQIGNINYIAVVLEYFISRGLRDLISEISIHTYPDTETMVFAPIIPEVANEITIFKSYTVDSFSLTSYFMSTLLTPIKSEDFKRLNDVKSMFLSNGLEIFYSDTMSEEELSLAFYHNRYMYPFKNLYPYFGEFASYLLRESTFFEYYIHYTDGHLYIGECSQRESLDIKDKFKSILRDLYSQDLEFVQLEDVESCSVVAKYNNLKGFEYDHEWYIAFPKNTSVDLDFSSSIKTDSVNMWSKVVSTNQETRMSALKFYELLNYDIENSVDVFRDHIEVFMVETEEGTDYKYLSSQGVNVNIVSVDGDYDEEYRELIESNLNDGEYFRLLVSNVYRSENYLLAEPCVHV